jgi:hypothetical protein
MEEEADKSLQAYDELYQSIPSIGFLSRKKRVSAYLKVTKVAQRLIDEQEVTEEQALFLLSILARKNSSFQKATVMTALNLARIDRKHLQPIGFKYANAFRCSLQFLPVDDNESS